MRASAIPLLLPLVSACTVGPDYTRPDIDAPDRFVSQDVLQELGSADDGTEFPANWWEGFSDPVLTRMVENALEHNYRIAGSVARLEAARAGVALADAGDNPRGVADIETGAEEQVRLDDGDSSADTTLLGSLGVIWPWDISGANRRELEAARAALEAAESELRGDILDVSSQVVREYLFLRGNQRQLALLEQSVALQEETLAIVRSRYEAGLSPELDLRRAEASVASLRARIPPLRQSLLDSRNRLATLTGRYPGIYEESLQERRSIPAFNGRIPDQVPLTVLNRRPDVQQAEAGLKQAIADIGVARAEFYPVLELSSSLAIGSRGIGAEPATNLLIGSLSALIQQVIWDSGAIGASVDIARARARAALMDYRQTLLAASEEVEATLSAIQSSRQSQIALEEAVRSSTLSFSQAESLYQQGLISFLDVVDAQRVLADAEQALAAERTNTATRIATLFRALGTEIDHSTYQR